MNRKLFVAAAVATAGMLTAGAASAHVNWVIGVNVPGVVAAVTAPAYYGGYGYGPGYYAAPAAYYAPPPVYVAPRYYAPAPVAYYGGYYGGYRRGPVFYGHPVGWAHRGYYR